MGEGAKVVNKNRGDGARYPWIIALVVTVGAGAAFWADVATGPGVGAPLLHVALVLLATLGHRAWVVWWSAGLGAIATVGGHLVQADRADWWTMETPLINRGLTVALVVMAALAGTALLRRGQELRQASEALHDTHLQLDEHTRLLRVANDLAKIGGWSIDLEADSAISASSETLRILGWDPDQPLTPEGAFGSFVADDGPEIYRAFELCAAEAQPFSHEARIDVDGAQRWVRVIGEPVVDRKGNVVRIQGSFQDITAMKEAQRLEGRFTQLADSLSVIVWTADPDGSITFYNEALERYTGRPREELLGRTWGSVIHPDDLERVNEVWRHSVATGEDYDIQLRFRSASGEYRWYHLRASAERDAAGAVVQWWGHSIDIHEHVVLKAKAQALAVDREDILQSIGDAVYSLDREWRFTYLNRNAESLLRRPARDLVGQVVWEAFPEARETGIYDAYERAMSTRSAQRITEYYPPLEKWFDITATPSPQGLTVYFRDITEFRNLSEQLAQSQRLEAIGRLTGGIAHDFNNLLTVVMGGVESLEQDALDHQEEVLDMMKQAAGRGAELTHRLLAFARRQPLEPESVDVSRLIEDFVPLLSRTLGDSIKVATHLVDDLPKAHVDPGQLESALLNLAINARDAMPSGGVLTIETTVADIDEAVAHAHGEVVPGRYVVVAMSDTGEGIAAEHIPRLFDPFFTTKDPGYGTGLGLPMVWGFAKQTGGHVSVYSEVGHGTTFRLYLPLAPDGLEPTRRADATARPAGPGSGHVLLVEDDLLVLQFAAHQLRSHGYTVSVAGSGPQALDMLDRIHSVDLVLTDVMMPGGMSGRDVAREIERLRPGTPVVYTSGYTENVVLHQGKVDDDVTLLAKPYTSHELLSVVGEHIRRPDFS